MQHIDLTDPDWMAKRNASWLILEEYLSDDYSMRDISVIKDVFFTGNYDLDNPKHKRFFDWYGSVSSMFKYYPLKRESFWREYVTEILPYYLSMKGESFKIENEIFSLGYYERERTVYGWSVEEEVRAHNFFLGSRYKLGKIKCLEYEFKNPIKPERVVIINSKRIREWLGYLNADNKYIHLLDYYFDAIRCLDKKYYSIEIMSGQDGWPQEMLQKLINTAFNYNQLTLVEEYKKANEVVLYKNDDYENNRRILYAKMLADRFSILKKPAELFHLVETCKQPEFKFQKYRYKLKPVNLP